MKLSIFKTIVLLSIIFIQATLATESKKTTNMHKDFFGFPGAVSQLADPAVKYYRIIRDSDTSNRNYTEYFSVLHQGNLPDSNAIYIDNFLSKSIYTSYKKQIEIEPVVDHKNHFNPISEVYLEITNKVDHPIIQSVLPIKNTKNEDRDELFSSNSNTLKNINEKVDFNDIVTAFNEWFVKHECLIKTNTKYYLKILSSDIENNHMVVTIIVKKNKENLEQEYFILSKNCKVIDANITNGMKKRITIINSPKHKIIHNIMEKFNFDCSQFGIGGVTSSIKLFVETFIAPRLLEKTMREKINMNISRGGILYGPPGTGKTLFIAAIKNIMEANNLKVKVIKISGPEIFSRYVGDSEEAVRKIFASAKDIEEEEIAIILIDEIDAMLSKRGTSNANGGTDRVVNQFLTCLDGIDQKNETQSNIIVFGTTNRIDLIDSAVTRPGRMDVKIAFNLPNNEQRQEIFEIQTNCLTTSGFLNSDVVFQDLASKTSGYTGAEIASIVQKSQLVALREAQGLTPNDNYFYPNKIYNIDSIDVNAACFDFAMNQVQPQFGKKSFMDTTNRFIEKYTAKNTIQRLKDTIEKFKTNKDSTLLIHITGQPKSGKSTLAALIVEYFGSSCCYLAAKDCAPYSREGKKGVLIDALNTGDISTETNNFSIILDDFDDIIEYEPTVLPHNVPLVSIVKSYAKSSIHNKKGKLFIIIISSKGESFLSNIFEKDNCFDLNQITDQNIYSYDDDGLERGVNSFDIKEDENFNDDEIEENFKIF